MKTIIKLAFGLVISFLAVSCQEDDSPIVVPSQHVLLLYMGGDNNLSGETDQKIEAIRKAWNGSLNDRLVVYQDTYSAPPTLVEIVKEGGQNVKKIIKTYPEENSADAAVFGRVIQEVKLLYPSPSYGLLLFSHASGWLPQATLLQPRTVIVDKKDEMDIVDFAKAIPDKAFDYIVFEACFMSGIEVMYELKDKTDYIVGSSAEILSPGFTPIYPQIINNLFEPTPNLKAFTETAFNYFNSKTGYEQSATFTVVKTAELSKLAAWIKANVDQSASVNIFDLQHFDRYSYRLFFDFEDYFSRLLKTEQQKTELKNLISKCIVYKAATPYFMLGWNGFEVKLHSGLTTYVQQEKYPYLNDEYKKLSWYINALK